MDELVQEDYSGERLAAGLGWFSVGLGAAELLAPDVIAGLIGVRPTAATAAVLRGFGAREMATGLAILAQPDQPAWIRSRIAGDALDLASLATVMARESTDRRRALAACIAVAGVAAVDVLCAQRLDTAESRYGSARTRPRRHAHVRVEQAVTINRPIEEVYAFWRQYDNFPRFMRHVVAVEVLGNGRSRWRAKAPGGLEVDWEAETLQDRENEWIAWRSVEGSRIQNSGSVRFTRAPGARGTEVRVQLEYHPPAGALGRRVAWLFGEEPEQQVKEDLRRFKQLMETGEIPLSEGPGMWRAAQPAPNPERLRSLAGVQR